ncbi:unnamed protein product [Bursaphelenchus xylophilus]|uniref:(pine wood nematode) hypothetical protein n=1 Tax=Bursaphelenchus xylophilus TaxID=6326 RepID=A0A1I7S5G9_BURXY|nr:unnamed protein product [Bursaphelenchus xylophilus]CAG9118068.1 unnamed protein product [Bursaphelenchus xylophilus]
MRLSSVLALFCVAVLAISVFAAPDTRVTRGKKNGENGRGREHPATRGTRDVQVVHADAAAPIADAKAPGKREAGFNVLANIAATRSSNGGRRKPDNRRVTRPQNKDNIRHVTPKS